MSLKRRTLLNTPEYNSEAQRASEYLSGALRSHERTLRAVADDTNAYSTLWGIVISVLVCAALVCYLYAGVVYAYEWVTNTLWILAVAAVGLISSASFINLILRTSKKSRLKNLQRRIADLSAEAADTANHRNFFSDAKDKGYDVPLQEKGSLRDCVDTAGEEIKALAGDNLRAWDVVFSIIYFVAFAVLSVLAASLFYYGCRLATDALGWTGLWLDAAKLLAKIAMFLTPTVTVLTAFFAWRAAGYRVTHPVTLTYPALPLAFPVAALLLVLSPLWVTALIVFIYRESETAGKLILTGIWAAVFGTILFFLYNYMQLYLWIGVLAVLAVTIIMLIIDACTGGWRTGAVILSYPMGITLIWSAALIVYRLCVANNILTDDIVGLRVLVIVCASMATLAYIPAAVAVNRSDYGDRTHLSVLLCFIFALLLAAVSPVIMVLSPLIILYLFQFCFCPYGDGCDWCDDTDDWVEDNIGCERGFICDCCDDHCC